MLQLIIKRERTNTYREKEGRREGREKGGKKNEGAEEEEEAVHKETVRRQGAVTQNERNED